jgi:predicted ArsR family transcriptional regulator
MSRHPQYEHMSYPGPLEPGQPQPPRVGPALLVAERERPAYPAVQLVQQWQRVVRRHEHERLARRHRVEGRDHGGVSGRVGDAAHVEVTWGRVVRGHEPDLRVRVWLTVRHFTTVGAVENAGRLGPAPVRGNAGPGALGDQRAAVLECLDQRGRPSRALEVAADLGVHVNTAREHLDALVARGVVVRERAGTAGRGRPPWLYAAAAGCQEPDPRVRDYAGLAAALAGHVARTSTDPGGDAVTAGLEWGRELAVAAPAGDSPRHRVVRLLDSLGFACDPDPEATTVALRQCPLLDAARRHPGVVCGVHLGVVRGALDVLGGDPERTALLPFSEPGACRLLLLAPPYPVAGRR